MNPAARLQDPVGQGQLQHRQGAGTGWFGLRRGPVNVGLTYCDVVIDPRPSTTVLSSAVLEAQQDLLSSSRLAAPYELAGLITRCVRQLGAQGATAYLVDLQQQLLLPLVDPAERADEDRAPAVSVDGTLAGRAFQTEQTQLGREGPAGPWVCWLPLLAGSNRLGVLSVALGGPGAAEPDRELLRGLAQVASTAADLIVAKTPYGDTLVRLRRRTPLGLAAELQYAVLPPLTFTSRPVNVSAALEPCYQVAGDAIDYAVDDGRTRVAIFDGMGHGLHSAQCAVLTVAAYRNARRSGLTLTETVTHIDQALTACLGGEVFTTAVLADLDTRTGLLHWVNAGHPAPMLIRSGKLVRHLESVPRPPIGLGYLLPDVPMDVGTEQLEPGDLVLLYTDGVVEARSPGGEFFGVARLQELVVRQLAGGLTPPETLRRVVRELLDHHEQQLPDDATFLMVEWRNVTNTADTRQVT